MARSGTPARAMAARPLRTTASRSTSTQARSGLFRPWRGPIGPRSIGHPHPPMHDESSLRDALALMRDLRARCDWDAAQTHESLRPYLLEEAHETDDAIRARDDGQLRDELGDVLLQVLFHAVIAEERGAFSAGDVAAALVAKM